MKQYRLRVASCFSPSAADAARTTENCQPA